MEAFVEGRVEQRLQAALERVRVILDATKDPQAAGDVHHQYEDKYLLVEGVTNAAVASQLNSFGALGLTLEHVQKLQEWSQGQSRIVPIQRRGGMQLPPRGNARGRSLRQGRSKIFLSTALCRLHSQARWLQR